MKFPTEFKFGHIKYNILYIPEMRDEEGKELGGMHRLHDGRIFIIEGEDTPEYKRLVLMHEVLHAIQRCQGIADLKEEQIDGIAFGIIQAMQQNSWMREFFG